MPKEPFHEDIARIIENIIGTDKVIRSDHCGGKCELHLYYEFPKGDKRPYILCHPDLLVNPRDTITGIVEIEERNITKQGNERHISPSSLFGNFTAASAAKCYIPSSTDEQIELDKSVLFIQILGTEKQEDEQLRIVKHYIRNIILKLDGKITQYELFYGETLDFESNGRLWSDFNKAIKAMGRG